nr:hypothetical protein HAGR004_16760 [Bdellovibrio sp. HAGR004]
MLSVLSLILFSSLTFAGGDWVGNGGNVLECASSEKVQLLDYYEGQQQRQISVNLGPGATYQEKVLFALDRLKAVNPTRAAQYMQWFASFAEETQWFSEGKFLPIRDSGAVIIPVECEIRQIAIQRPEDLIMPGDKRYLVDLRLWNRLSEQDKAGLVLHELIYREGIENGQSSSPRVRYFNQILSSSEISTYNSLQLLKLVKQVGFGVTDYYGWAVNLRQATYHDNGTLRGALGVGGFWQSVSLKNRWIGFYENGSLAHFSIDSLEPVSVSVFGQEVTLQGEGTSASLSRISFYEDGTVESMPVKGSMQINLQGQSVRVANTSGGISFWPDGSLREGTLLDVWHYGEERQAVQGAVELDEKGHLIRRAFPLF